MRVMVIVTIAMIRHHHDYVSSQLIFVSNSSKYCNCSNRFLRFDKLQSMQRATVKPTVITLDFIENAILMKLKLQNAKESRIIQLHISELTRLKFILAEQSTGVMHSSLM